MYTSYIGRRAINLYNEHLHDGDPLSPKRFFDQVFFPVVFDDDDYLMQAGNSKFGQLVRQRKKDKREAEEQAAEARARRQRIDRVAQQGERAWEEALNEINSRKPRGYQVAANLLRDLRALADERDELPAFQARLAQIVEAHRRKGRFLEQLKRVGILPPE